MIFIAFRNILVIFFVLLSCSVLFEQRHLLVVVLAWIIPVPNVCNTLFQSPNDATRLFSAGRRFSTSVVMTRSGPTSPCNRRQQYNQFTDEQIVL